MPELEVLKQERLLSNDTSCPEVDPPMLVPMSMSMGSEMACPDDVQANAETHFQAELGTLLRVWVDADSCPKVVRRVLLRAAARLNAASGTSAVAFHFVAAVPQPIYPDPAAGLYVQQVAPGTDAVDNFIEQHCQSGDIVITRDIVLAERLCLSVQQNPSSGGSLRVINDRGVEYTWENVTARRLRRDLALELRNADILPQSSKTAGGYSSKDLQRFAACLDGCLNQQVRNQKAKIMVSRS